VRGVLDAVYRLEFETAEARCRQMMAARPSDPAGAVYLARVYWQQLLVGERALTVHRFTQPDFFVGKPPEQLATDPAAVEKFRRASAEAIRLAEAAAKKNPRDPAALFLLGVAYQNEAAFLLAIKRDWWAAIRAGNRSERAHQDLLLADRQCADGLLVTGVFHYTVGAVPWAIRWIPLLLGYHGSKETGRKEIEQAAAQGQLVADDARALLAVLDEIEGKHKEALGRLRVLESRYPENVLTQMDIGGILLRTGQAGAAIETYRKALGQLERGGGAARVVERAAVWNQLGVAERAAGHAAESEQWLKRTAGDASASAQSRARGQLELGKTLDAAGRRKEAVAQYEQVLRQRDFAGTQAEASRYLRKAYQGS
jgi:tetratricopeptide (TPR) repeat protein